MLFTKWNENWAWSQVKIIGDPISDGIVFVFHLPWCAREFKRITRFWPYLMAFRSCISSGKPKYMIVFDVCLFVCFLFSDFMMRNLCGWLMHVCKIWNIDLTYYQVRYELTELWKAFRHFLTSNRKKNKLRKKKIIILAVKRTLWACYLPRVHLKK